MVRGSLVVIAALALLVAWFFLLRPEFLGGPAGYVLVSGKSMEPALYSGDLVVTRKQSDYRVGDVVAFRVPQGEPAEGGIVIHRITGGNAQEGFIVQGDNRSGPDMWRPRPENIVGKQWLHFPGGSRFVLNLRQPVNLGILVGSLSALSLFGGEKMKRRRRGNGGGGHRRTNGNPSPGAGLPGPGWALALLGVAALLTLGLAAAAAYSFIQPTQKTQTVERLRYEHTAAFDYTAQVEPSSLYPSGVIGPVTPPARGSTGSPRAENGTADPEPDVEGPPIYTKLAKSLDLGFAYELEGSEPPQVSGEMSAALQIRAGENGWTKTLELVPPTPFSGPTASFRVPIDFAQVWAVIETIEEETEFKASAYDLSVIPTVRIRGTVGPEAVDEVFAPPFTLTLTRTQITPDGQLARSEVRTFQDTVTLEQRLHLFNLSMPVATARWASAGGATVALALVALLAAVVFLGLGQPEAAKIRARYGSLLISVAQADLKEDGQNIRVATMQDLVRLAQRDGRTIFHQALGADSHLYFVHDGTVTYQYTLAPQSEPTGEEA